MIIPVMDELQKKMSLVFRQLIINYLIFLLEKYFQFSYKKILLLILKKKIIIIKYK